MRKLLTAAATLIAACLALALIGTARWPQISDDVLMHYVVFLMRHGMAPYRQIIDINMPGNYLMDEALSFLVGNSALAWRFVDWAFLAAAAAAMVFLVGRNQWQAGCFAAGLFALWHLADGPAQADQRDFFLAVLLLCGSACLQSGLKANRSAPLLAWGIFSGTASTLKPQALVLLPAILLLIGQLPRPTNSKLRLAAWGMFGWLAPLVLVLLWLVHWRSLSSFEEICVGLIPYHAAMARHSTLFLLGHALPAPLLLLLASALVASRPRSMLSDLRIRILIIYLAFGLFSFWVQGKAYPYHRYPLLVFAFSLLALILAERQFTADHGRGTVALTVMILYGALWLAPACAARAMRWNWQTQPALQSLQADLTTLAGGRSRLSNLQSEVQCLDTMAGCITVLDRMDLVQSTGFLYDCYFFAPIPGSVEDQQRRRFLSALGSARPLVIVITDQWCLNLPSGYAKLQQWPQFHALLTSGYQLRIERSWRGTLNKRLATYPFGYRIYTRSSH